MSGIFGIHSPKHNIASMLFQGMFSLQHRGPESAGFITNGDFDHPRKKKGLATNVIPEDLEDIVGNEGIGTVSSSIIDNPENLPPHRYSLGENTEISIVMDGNITNYKELRRELLLNDQTLVTNQQTEVIANIINKAKGSDLSEKLTSGLLSLEGSYSMIILSNKGIMAARDKLGTRPLFMGFNDDYFAFSSETRSFDLFNMNFYISEVQPGTIVMPAKSATNENKVGGYIRLVHNTLDQSIPCIYEELYLSMPDSKLNNDTIDKSRRQFGRELGKYAQVDADIVIGVPDSASTIGLGYSNATNIPYELGIIRNHYVGRARSNGTAHKEFDVKRKYNVTGNAVENKKVVLVDENLLEGITAKTLITMLKDKGASEVHLRVSSPPIFNSCPYGVNFPPDTELLMHKLGLNESNYQDNLPKIAESLGADSVAFLPIDKMTSAGLNQNYCNFCFDKNR